MMNASWGAKTTSIRKVVREIAEQSEWNIDRQMDRQLFNFIYIDAAGVYQGTLVGHIIGGISSPC